MTGNEVSAMYSVKVLEYLIAVAYLMLFVPFWRFVNAEAAGATATVAQTGWLGSMAGWFHVPDSVYFHPGHAWVRLGAGQVVTAGMDDFAQRLVGAVSAIQLPAVGTELRQGEPAWILASGPKSVAMLSPVDGTVTAVNEQLAAAPQRLGDDPYGEQRWFVKLRAPRIKANLKQLLGGALARRFMDESCEVLRAMMSPALGQLCEDGGVPVEGMAKSLDPKRWDEIARRFLLTETTTEANGEWSSSEPLDARREGSRFAH